MADIIKVTEPFVGLIYPLDTHSELQVCERAGRIRNNSEERLNTDSYEMFIRGAMTRKDYTPLEHSFATLKIVCDQRVASILSEHHVGVTISQELPNYRDLVNAPIKIIRPVAFDPAEPQQIQQLDDQNGEAQVNKFTLWYSGCMVAAQMYRYLMQIYADRISAQAVLPMSLATTLCITASLRGWRHMLTKHCAPSEQLDVQHVMLLALALLHDNYIVVFDDLYKQYAARIPVLLKPTESEDVDAVPVEDAGVEPSGAVEAAATDGDTAAMPAEEAEETNVGRETASN